MDMDDGKIGKDAGSPSIALHPGTRVHLPSPSVLLELTKLRISGASTFTAATGFIAYHRGFGWSLIPALSGTLLLAMGASALNEAQEHGLDALMERTRHRPIPRGDISASGATLFALALAASGFALLLLLGWTPALLGLLAMIWYNGIYTPLKRVSAFAVVPGSLIGALPPAIGWTAAGGSLADPALVGLAFVLFIWQVPHFWLLALLHREAYEKAGFPTLSKHFDEPQIRRLIFTWSCAAVAACAALPAFHMLSALPALVLLYAGCLWQLARSTRLLRHHFNQKQLWRAFMDINLFALMVMAAVVVDAVLAR
jgi:heme o synthase